MVDKTSYMMGQIGDGNFGKFKSNIDLKFFFVSVLVRCVPQFFSLNLYNLDYAESRFCNIKLVFSE